MAPVKCCVEGCKHNIQPQHRFPNPKKDFARFQQWLALIGNPNISSMDPKVVYDLKKVCHCHFDSSYYSTGRKRLHQNALPTLNLPIQSITEANTRETLNKLVDTTFSQNDVIPVLDLDSEGTSKKNISDSFGSLKSACHMTLSTQKLSSENIDSVPSIKIRPGTCQNAQQMLKEVGINVRKDMTPRKNKLYGIVKKLSRKLKRTSCAKDSFKKRLFEAEKFSKEKSLEENLSCLNKIAAQFIKCQLREANRAARQHRFTLDEKILALTLFKKSPKCYRFLSKVFILPSRSTLTNFLNEIDFNAGINMQIFDSLKKKVAKMSPSERFISLMWDEMSIAPSLNFNERKGYIEGLHDFGEEDRPSEIADHVLVFMIRGLKFKIKQPICYAFSSKGGAKAHQIKTILKIILEILLKIGLKPITTVCDQAATNVKVLNTLIKETKEKCIRENIEYTEGYFTIQNFNIFPIFDPPHLLKGIRNNFIDKSLRYGIGSNKKIAKWEHIVKLYEIDNASNVIDGLRALPYLTDEHVYQQKIKKMKVKYAAQIFSQRLAVTLNLAAKLDIFNSIGKGCDQTAEIIYFFDQLFDSVNGSNRNATNGKKYRCGISDDSGHLKFWMEEALPLLNSMEFEVQRASDRAKPPSLKNWIFTIKNFIRVWNVLKLNGFEYILGRHFNQDPIENLFGKVRSHGVLHTNPTASNFTSIFKTIVVNSAVKNYSSSFNCEDDECEMLFDDVKLFFKSHTDSSATEIKSCSSSAVELASTSTSKYLLQPSLVSNKLGDQMLQIELSTLSTNYVAGFVLKKIKKNIHQCKICTENVFGNPNDELNILIKEREYLGGYNKRLCYPNKNFAETFLSLFQRISNELKVRGTSKRFSEICNKEILEKFDCSLLCDEHKVNVARSIFQTTFRTIVHNWCRCINRILNGRDTRTVGSDDVIKQKAKEMFLKRRNRLNKGKKIL